MRYRNFSFAAVVAAFATTVHGAEPTAKRPPPPARPAESGELGAIRQTAGAFQIAFNAADAKAVAALWTKDGEYIDEAGKRIAGRDAIANEYAQFFHGNPGAKMTVVIDSLRQVSDNTAIEDGRAVVELGRTRGTYSNYTAVHTKTDGKWLMSSVRDTHSGSLAAANQVQDLEWLVGKWSAEESGAKMAVDCQWLDGKNYLERKFSVTRDGKTINSGLQIIGWNPQAERIQSWMFAGEGGQASGLWGPIKNGWAIETSGMGADGMPTQAVNIVTRIDENAITWQSVERSAGGVKLPDAEEVLLKRVVAKR